MKKAFLLTVPVLTGYIVLGIGFGMVLHANGFGILYAVAMSTFIYAGSMQYALVPLMTGGASLLTVAATTFVVNARHLFYGISMVDRYKDMGTVKPYLIFALTDETYSIVCRDDLTMDPAEKKKLYTQVSLLDHFYWVFGSFLGSLAGELLPINTKGVDFALTALFITVFTQQWLEAKQHTPAITGLLVTFVCLLVFGKSSFLIPSMILIMLLLLAIRKKWEAGEVNA